MAKTKKRLTGLSGGNAIVSAGLQWDHVASAGDVARRVLIFLRDRRILFEDESREDYDSCRNSAGEIRTFLTNEIMNMEASEHLESILERMRASSRIFVTRAGENSIEFRRSHRRFVESLRDYRDQIGEEVGWLVRDYNLTLPPELADLVPPEDPRPFIENAEEPAETSDSDDPRQPDRTTRVKADRSGASRRGRRAVEVETEEGNPGAPLTIARNNDRYLHFQFLGALVESVVDSEAIEGESSGSVVIAPDASVIATLDEDERVDLWDVGSSQPRPGPSLGDLIGGGGLLRLLAVDRPLGQILRLLVARDRDVYSLVKPPSAAWTATLIGTARAAVCSAAGTPDDTLLVLEDGTTEWLSGRSSGTWALRTVAGADAGMGDDGRAYIAAWGIDSRGTQTVTVFMVDQVRTDHLFSCDGTRAGIVRITPSVVDRRRAHNDVTVAVRLNNSRVQLVDVKDGLRHGN